MWSDPDAPCPKEIPPYYFIVLHTFAAISVPINIFGIYLVWTHSPKGSNYKYCLTYVQIVALVAEIYMTWICPGFYFFPMLGGYNSGEFYKIFFDVHTGMSIWLVLFCFELPAIVWCFMFRNNAVLEMTRATDSRKNLKRVLLFVCHVLPFLTGFNFYKAELTFEQKYIYLKQNFPQCLHYLQFSGFSCYDYNQNIWVVVAGVGTLAFVLIFVVYLLFLAFQTIFVLHKMRKHMSAQTYRMHKTALMSLSMQVAIPSTLVVIPVYFILMVVVYKLVELQEMATCMDIVISSHSLFASIIMILTNPRYRTWVASKLRETLLKIVWTRNEKPVVRIASVANTSFVN